MSATTEKLLEQISYLENEIAEATKFGNDTTELVSSLEKAKRLFNECNSLLNESKTVLKG